MLTKETIEQALPFIEESWWLMCDASAEDAEIKKIKIKVLYQNADLTIVQFVWSYGELAYKDRDMNSIIDPEPIKNTDYKIKMRSSDTPRKLVKEVHYALEHIMKEPYDYYLEED